MTYFLKDDPTIYTKNLFQSCKFFKLWELSHLVFWSFLQQLSYTKDNGPNCVNFCEQRWQMGIKTCSLCNLGTFAKLQQETQGLSLIFMSNCLQIRGVIETAPHLQFKKLTCICECIALPSTISCWSSRAEDIYSM